MENNKKVIDIVIKSLAVFGAVVLFSGAGFLTITVIRNTPSIFSNITAAVVNVTQRFIPAERIVLTLDETNPENGDIVNLSFEHLSKSDTGSYAFFYECRDGIHFERKTQDSNNGDVIFCNTPYRFVSEDNTLSFKVVSSKALEVEVPISINFIKNNSDRISERGEEIIIINGKRGTIDDGGTIIIEDNSGNTGGTERKPGDKLETTFLFDETSGTYTGVSDPNGVIDLKATILEVGMIDKITNVFTATSSVSNSDRGAVKFEIENIGTKEVSFWRFNVVVPTFPAFIYYSTSQQTLLPGDKIQYTIGFDSIKVDGTTNTIVVNVDPTRSIKESNEENNIVKAELPAYPNN